MSALCPDPEARARKNLRAVLQGLARVGQATLAAELHVSESTVSRMKSDGDLERLAHLLAHCGLKVVPEAMRCYEPEYVDWLLLGNRIAADKVRSADDLQADDPE